jgi:S-DNA-T family DNA segregation ATPase FtsK/SpoIIIE
MQKIEESLVDKADGKSAAAEAVVEETDPLFDDAVEVLLETGQASVSMLQRRLKLGYSRAARLIDQMEERGVVGPFEGSKPRQLLISRASWDAYKSGGADTPDASAETADTDEEEPRQIDIPIPEELPEGSGDEAAPWDKDIEA